ncbi:MAG TPA: phenylalanine--tRNA ligase beta subunit-related protein [Kofleriaceae bacterium]|jgi:DNA/RNA-binding domain of Phe-tRNA-synthetase-like protein|nr:phenylalanine--tRNA ligase beta subunit-related protein [Kofleriaceae bacterium]
MPLTLAIEPHPLLDLGAFVTRTAHPLAELATPAAIARLAEPEATAPVAASEQVKTAVRDLLRHGGYKPSGRSKPASEYLAAALARREFPRINALVDACNVVSLHAGLPISLVDVDRLDHSGALTIRVAPPGTSYVFNPSGQTIDAGGLVCLYDAQGPTGTPVKDAQRTKTHDGTVATLAIVWGTHALAGRTAGTTRWYRDLVREIAGATIEDVALA